MQEAEQSFDIVPTHLAVQAMRDNGYRNAAYAIAELMDNAVQAGASVVELLCAERTATVNLRVRTRVEQIAVLDNGCGMDEGTLRLAMQFGNGTRLESGKQDGIGRFGMGLPASSISQCTRLDVWTWQQGVDSALHTYLDLKEIQARRQSSVPRPTPEAVPEVWRRVGNGFGASGTLVVWSDLDRCIWRTAGAIIDNSEFVVGRMYRKWLDDGRVKIRFTAFNLGGLTEREGMDALPNDPGYLMSRTSCPAPYSDTPLFEPLKDDTGQPDTEKVFQVEFRGETHPVTVRFSLAKSAARDKSQAGSTPYGKHAKNNVGVSVMRAERELELDQSLVIQYDPVERWWGVEVDFSPALDDLFGVTNNKQSARNFADIAKNDLDVLLKTKTLNQALEELRENGDPRGPLLSIINDINNHIKRMRAQLTNQTAGVRSLTATAKEHVPETEATARTKQRQEAGHIGQSDKDEDLPKSTRIENAEQTLRDIGLPAEIVDTLAATIVRDNLKYRFVPTDLGSAAFFQIKNRGTGSIIIALNTQHPVYESLIEVLEESTTGVSPEELKRRLNGARDGLKTLLIAWARYEDELPEGQRRQAAQNARDDWGRVARDFLTQSE
jgi:hypothetical protein